MVSGERWTFTIHHFAFTIESVRRRKTAIFFVILCVSLSLLAAALNIGWIILNLREVALLVLGVVIFALIITGLILNTIFLVREIRRNEQHDAFLNAVTHELKTPIASIKLYLETLKARDLDPAKRQEFYNVMLADNQRLLSTVEQVLHASRAREKQRMLSTETIDLADLLIETIQIVRTRHQIEDSTIRFSGPSEPVMLVGDRADLQTAFANLIDNAVKYSGDSGPRILVRLKLSVTKKAEVYIKDNGAGIARSDLKRIFKRFYRAPGHAAAAKGTGLGLPIVRSIIERHGGRVGAESKGEGRGSTFFVKLPTV
ncbi:MAG: sensor histidine kinase [Pyrinomonadaceae bacterium]